MWQGQVSNYTIFESFFTTIKDEFEIIEGRIRDPEQLLGRS